MDMPLVAVRRKGKENDDAKMYMVKSTKRPPKRMEHDFTIGRLPDRRIEDEELDKENEGKVCVSRFGINRLGRRFFYVVVIAICMIICLTFTLCYVSI